jgi:hypothetical protein
VNSEKIHIEYSGCRKYGDYIQKYGDENSYNPISLVAVKMPVKFVSISDRNISSEQTISAKKKLLLKSRAKSLYSIQTEQILSIQYALPFQSGINNEYPNRIEESVYPISHHEP